MYKIFKKRINKKKKKKKLRFFRNSNFIRESAAAAASGSSVINSQENLMAESYYGKVAGRKPVTLQQQSSTRCFRLKKMSKMYM